MPDESALALAAVRRLPPAALAGLREAFAVEVAERLPRLQAAVATGRPEDLTGAVRDAHSLGSSAVVVGEPDASRAARAAESLLLELQAGTAGDGQLPALRTHVEDLARRLAGWQP